MKYSGAISSKRTGALVEKCAELINCGVCSSQILVICASPYKKNDFCERLKNLIKIEALKSFPVHTYFGLCYHAIQDNWPNIENSIKDKNATLAPNLCSLEVSQFIFKNAIKEIEFKGYNSKVNLIHQLLRRWLLIVQNNLDDKEVLKRSEILRESFKDEAKNAINQYKYSTLKLRAFDYIRQASILPFIYKKTDYFKEIKYLFIDDADEAPQSVFEFYQALKPNLKESFIAFDPNGSSRIGYLSAKKQDDYNEKIIELKSSAPLYKSGEKLFNSIIAQEPEAIEGFKAENFVKRSEMLDFLINKILKLKENGATESDISIIAPSIDLPLKTTLKNAPFKTFYLSGSSKLSEDGFIKGILVLLKIIYSIPFNSSELRALFIEVLQIPLKYSLLALNRYQDYGNFEEIKFENSIYQENFEKFLQLTQNKTQSASEKLLQIYNAFSFKNEQIKKLSRFFKQVKDFEDVLGPNYTKNMIIQLENTLISENPLSAEIIERDSIIVSTPQKIIDNEIKTKFQFWLDCSSSSWQKQDTGPLYNSWVFQKDWEKETFEAEDSYSLNLEKTARILRKLSLCAKEKIYILKSEYDNCGVQNFGGIDKWFISQIDSPKGPTINIIAREDQKAVLDYKSGKMAVTAVPGSGKTTIMLALIIKLLNSKVNGENIFVLTYMDSACKNFKERIKKHFPNLQVLPQISTIHGLALRILKENNNCIKANLEADFEVCDELSKVKIIQEIFNQYSVSHTEADTYLRAISIFKLNGSKAPKNRLFNSIMDEYCKYLSQNNLIDYDDMLILSYKILKENADIREFYQKKARYIIEDEAQDSSLIQQKLLELIGGEKPNIIRCGDINQAIMSTFSNSDTEGFKTFIENSNKVEMNKSQRCSLKIYSLANSLIEEAKFKNAFYQIKMNPVEGKNPVSKTPLKSYIFEEEKEERDFILSEIKKIIKNEPKASIGLLTRNNFTINSYSEFLQSFGVNVNKNSGALIQNKEFRTILALLNIYLYPDSNPVILKSFETLSIDKFYEFSISDDPFIKRLKAPFITLSPDNIESFALQNFWWDLDFFLNEAHLKISEFALKIGLHYFKDSSNVFVIYDFLRRLENTFKTPEEVIGRLNVISDRANFNSLNFFKSENKEENKAAVEIMTMHKSKGAEFDYVFIPALNESNLALEVENVKIRSSGLFIERLKTPNPNIEKLKNDIKDEDLRLLYVAITRAKKRLYISAAKKWKVFGKIETVTPSLIFDTLLKEELLYEYV